jgi:hypothetical protein
MKKFQNQLKTVSDVLTTISKQIEQIAKSLAFEKPVKEASSKKVKTPVAKPAKIKKPATTKKTVKKKEAPETKEPSSEKPMSVLDSVLDKITRAKNGISISKIQEKPGLGDRQLSNALYKLSKKGKILSKSRGIYTKNQDYKEK